MFESVEDGEEFAVGPAQVEVGRGGGQRERGVLDDGQSLPGEAGVAQRGAARDDGVLKVQFPLFQTVDSFFQFVHSFGFFVVCPVVHCVKMDYGER